VKTWLWTALLIAGLAAIYPLQRRIDAQRGQAAVIEDSLYLSSGKTLRRLSLGYHALLADLYWLRTIQYFGGKIEQARQRKEQLTITDVSTWRLDLLEPLLTITTELDPNYIAAYRFGAIFLPDLNPEAGIRFVRRGIENNPDEWRLYNDLGYIYWKQERLQEAGEIYDRGSRISGAPEWMKTMQAIMLYKGGDRETARAIFQRMYESSDDAYTKQLSLARLKSLQAEDEIVLLDKLLAGYREQSGSCPPSLSALVRVLAPSLLEQMRRGGMQFNEHSVPLDPDGFPYEYNSSGCTVALADKSTIVRWKSFAK
jgi:tetratricopeptide (TPR) repeat protein